MANFPEKVGFCWFGWFSLFLGFCLNFFVASFVLVKLRLLGVVLCWALVAGLFRCGFFCDATFHVDAMLKVLSGMGAAVFSAGGFGLFGFGFEFGAALRVWGVWKQLHVFGFQMLHWLIALSAAAAVQSCPSLPSGAPVADRSTR